jgi:hypothetical protein
MKRGIFNRSIFLVLLVLFNILLVEGSYVDGCSNLSQVVIDSIREIQGDEDLVILGEGQKFMDPDDERVYVVLPGEGGRILSFEDAENSSYDDDTLSFRDFFSSVRYEVDFFEEGVGTINIGNEEYGFSFSGEEFLPKHMYEIWTDFPQTTGEDKMTFIDCPDLQFHSCLDSDGGQDYNMASFITTESGIYEDLCYNSLQLQEWYCEDNLAKSVRYNCALDIANQTQGCKDGACINEETVWCYDQDDCGGGGYSYGPYCMNSSVYRNYSVIDCINPGQPSSYCASESTMIPEFQYSCSGGCNNEGICVGGEDVCDDTDGGKNYFTKGTVSYDGGSAIDYCLPDGVTLRESYCVENFTVGFENFTCVEGCSFGTCLGELDQCIDGTPLEECSQTKPLFCKDGELIDRCASCGCDIGTVCNYTDLKCYDSSECLSSPEVKTSFLRSFGGMDHLAVGERLTVKTHVEDSCNNGLKNVTMEVLMGGERLAISELSCEPDDPSSYECHGGEWHATNVVENEIATYVLRITVTDNLNRSTQEDKEYELNFQSIDYNLCKGLVPGHNDPGENRANIVFVGFGYNLSDSYTPEEIFREVATNLVDLEGTNNGLFSLTPFRENPNKFNFWFVDKVSPIDFCDSRGNCEDYDLLTKTCPFNNKYTTRVIDANFRSAEAGQIKLSAPAYYQSIREYYCAEGESHYQDLRCIAGCQEGRCLGGPTIISPPSNNSCNKLNNEVILMIEELLGDGETVVLEEKQEIKEDEFFVVPGRILELNRLRNESWEEDLIEIRDRITMEQINVNLGFEGEADIYFGDLEVSIRYYGDYRNEKMIVTWGNGSSYGDEGNKKETFYDCEIQYDSCEDSDTNSNFEDGLNIYEEGIVNDLSGNYTDYCLGIGGIPLNDPLVSLGGDTPKVYVHEMGHLFGDLTDEYLVAEEPILDHQPPGQKSCWIGSLHTYEECLNDGLWSHLIGSGCGQEGILDCVESDANYNLEIGCYGGCGLWPESFRSARNTIMRAHATEPFSFGPWNEEVLLSKINMFSEA